MNVYSDNLNLIGENFLTSRLGSVMSKTLSKSTNKSRIVFNVV